MSAFEEIANDALPFASQDSSPQDSPGTEIVNAAEYHNDLLQVGELILSAENDCRREFVELLRQACLCRMCYETVVQLSGREAQVVADAIQLTLDELRLGDEFYRHALCLLVKLAASSHVLPTCLFVQGVDIGLVRDPVQAGGFADIFIGRYEGIDVAVKKLRFNIDRAQIYGVFVREALVWRQLNHPNVLPFIGVDAETFAETEYLCMVSPWMINGTLVEYIHSDHYRPDTDCDRLLCEISSGLAYLHLHKVIHGDIHIANVFISVDGHAQLADFGLAVVGDITQGRLSSMGGAGGHLRYMAPERVNPASSNSQRTSAADVYSFGCVSLSLHTGRQPFHYLNEVSVIFHVVNGGRPPRPNADECLTRMDDETWSLTERCWNQDPAERPSMAKIEEELLRRTLAAQDDPLRSIRPWRSHRNLVRQSVAPSRRSSMHDSTPTPRSRSPSIYHLRHGTPPAVSSRGIHVRWPSNNSGPSHTEPRTPSESGLRDSGLSTAYTLDPEMMEILSSLDESAPLATSSTFATTLHRPSFKRYANLSTESSSPVEYVVQSPNIPSHDGENREQEVDDIVSRLLASRSTMLDLQRYAGKNPTTPNIPAEKSKAGPSLDRKQLIRDDNDKYLDLRSIYFMH